MSTRKRSSFIGIEWPTLGLILATYAGWVLVTAFGEMLTVWLALPMLTLLLVLHSSLQHEMMHGHPFRDQRASDVLAWPGLGLFIPYGRFRALHLAHHKDANLTDPHDDPESFYFAPEIYARLHWSFRAMLEVNNTLSGRIVLGPLVGTEAFMRTEIGLIRRGVPGVLRDWLVHLGTVAGVLWWLANVASLPVWAYVIAAYCALSILKIRTFAEHQAHERAPSRSVIIEDRGPLAFLFLNNNLHAVHHSHPAVPWYALPRVFKAKRAFYLARNGGYHFPSYWFVLARYFFRAKEPLPHPLPRQR